MSDERWISLTGSGEASVAPDLAIVSFAVTGSFVFLLVAEAAARL